MIYPFFQQPFHTLFDPIFLDVNHFDFGKRYCRSNARRLRKIKLKRKKKAFR